MAPKAKPKAAPATATGSGSPAVSIEDLFTTLNRHIQEYKYSQAVKVADQVLSIAPSDEDAARCKVVALVKDEKFDEALRTIQEVSKKIAVDFSFLKAYCLYKQNKLDEALDLLKGQEETPETLVLEAQILYRLGKVDACVDNYQKLLKSKIESLEINVVAALVSAGKSSEVQGVLDSMRVKATSSHDLAYNVACSMIERGQYKDAEQLLLSAQRIAQEALVEDNYEADEIEIELAPINVQVAYVQQILGNTEEALASYANILKRNLGDDELTPAVAINNLIALKGPKDVSDGLRKLDRLSEKVDGQQSFKINHTLDLRLSTKQREAVYTNRVLLLLHSHKLDQARELVDTLSGMFPSSVTPVLLQAAVHVRENKAGKAEEILGQFAKKFPEKSRVVLLARAQIAAAAGHPQIAAESLAKIDDIQHMPATVATIVSLKERAGDIDGAEAVFDAAIKWWSNSMTEDHKLDSITQEAAAFKLKHGRRDEAARLYENLFKSCGSRGALVGLIQTAAYTDVEKAELYEKKLKAVPNLKAIDIDALEKTTGAKPEGSGLNLGSNEPSEPKSKEKAKKKRKRKPRYPKGFDPANPGPPPDPERWLPRKERSSYRPKRKDKRAAQVRGSQGAVVKEAGSNVSKSNQTSSSKGSSHNTEQPKASSKSSRKKSRN
ncbi:OLC1v1005681C1 [Oldenlandia corymbosa var. corymbosa]|uniref:Signal recognition particle subunit SRP72 n=1 Tax=Oldenlandia corymbosa var. corymbosa TaxID=529605 RepID=A0AAV1DFF4_OLDCO|nr:OLC1v1005681C1 [Oldenlandia corymbosa var. corymbosa]